MTIYDNYFPLGLGTSRFPISGPNDIAGIDKSIELVRHALERGANYVDTSYTYSAGMAQTVLKEAFGQTKKRVGVTVKVMHDMDKTADDARRRVELQLKAMGLEKAAFFTCWTIVSYAQFSQIIVKGGIYDGALKLKVEGVIDHICFSCHAPADDTIRIIESGAFEGATLSYSLLNAPSMQSVLDAALKHNVGVAIMNPLGGGVIPQNPDFFSFAKYDGDESVPNAARRFVKAHPAVNIVISGVGSIREIDENIKAFTGENLEANETRLNRALKSVEGIKNFCTGCNYCSGCPAEIPISEIMKMRNSLLFGNKSSYNRTEPRLVENIDLFRSHTSRIDSAVWFPQTADNPCIRCGQCESKCTQNLNIVDSIADMYDRAAKIGFYLEYRRQRIAELLYDRGYQKVGLYPNGGFANLIRDLYSETFGEPTFEWLQFNSDPKMSGELSGGLAIHSPNEIANIKPDIIVVCTYKYDSEIYESLSKYEDNGIKIVKLHKATDAPWVF
jgi:predicted aldo/keto reductase-like oxidoreductase